MDEKWSRLCDPIAADRPCGESLEDSLLLAAFDAFRVFGQGAALPDETDWRQIRDKAAAGLAVSRDFRLLTHLAAAELRLEGVPALVGALEVAARWLAHHWNDVYPLIDDDAILRRNALAAFADRMAIVNAFRRVPLLVHRQAGTFSLRDHELALGEIQPAEGDPPAPDATQIQAVLAAVSADDVTALHAALGRGLAALAAMDATMRERGGGAEAAPTLEPLEAALGKAHRLLGAALATRLPAEATGESDAAPDGAAGPVAVGAMRTREDALRALDAVAAYFRRNEPSSPIPLLLERTKRLVGKDFLAVIEDIAPDALGQAKLAGGVRDSEQ